MSLLSWHVRSYALLACIFVSPSPFMAVARLGAGTVRVGWCGIESPSPIWLLVHAPLPPLCLMLWACWAAAHGVWLSWGLFVMYHTHCLLPFDPCVTFSLHLDVYPYIAFRTLSGLLALACPSLRSFFVLGASCPCNYILVPRLEVLYSMYSTRACNTGRASFVINGYSLHIYCQYYRSRATKSRAALEVAAARCTHTTPPGRAGALRRSNT